MRKNQVGLEGNEFSRDSQSWVGVVAGRYPERGSFRASMCAALASSWRAIFWWGC